LELVNCGCREHTAVGLQSSDDPKDRLDNLNDVNIKIPKLCYILQAPPRCVA